MRSVRNALLIGKTLTINDPFSGGNGLTQGPAVHLL